MVCSPARLAANRANARKSTGPRTPEGKAASRENALKHGLTGAGEVLLVAVDEELARRLDVWEAHFRPADPVEDRMVRQIALATIRMERLADQEFALVEANRRRDLVLWDDDGVPIVTEKKTTIFTGAFVQWAGGAVGAGSGSTPPRSRSGTCRMD